MQSALARFRGSDHVGGLRNCESIVARIRPDGRFDRGLDRAKSFRRLSCEQACRADAGVEFRVENKASARHSPFDPVQLETHRRALESSALQRLSKFLRAFEQII